MRIIAAVLVVSLIAFTAGASSPQISFDLEGVLIQGVRPGSKVAWISIGRRHVDHFGELNIRRGISPANAGSLTVKQQNASSESTLWIVASVEDGAIVRAGAAGYEPSAVPLLIAGAPDQPAFTIVAPAVELILLRPKAGAWSFSAVDGGAGDADGRENGAIVVRTVSMTAFRGNDDPPATLMPGDVILAVDVQSMRVGTLEVKR